MAPKGRPPRAKSPAQAPTPVPKPSTIASGTPAGRGRKKKNDTPAVAHEDQDEVGGQGSSQRLATSNYLSEIDNQPADEPYDEQFFTEFLKQWLPSMKKRAHIDHLLEMLCARIDRLNQLALEGSFIEGVYEQMELILLQIQDATVVFERRGKVNIDKELLARLETAMDEHKKLIHMHVTGKKRITKPVAATTSKITGSERWAPSKNRTELVTQENYRTRFICEWGGCTFRGNYSQIQTHIETEHAQGLFEFLTCQWQIEKGHRDWETCGKHLFYVSTLVDHIIHDHLGVKYKPDPEWAKTNNVPAHMQKGDTRVAPLSGEAYWADMPPYYLAGDTPFSEKVASDQMKFDLFKGDLELKGKGRLADALALKKPEIAPYIIDDLQKAQKTAEAKATPGGKTKATSRQRTASPAKRAQADSSPVTDTNATQFMVNTAKSIVSKVTGLLSRSTTPAPAEQPKSKTPEAEPAKDVRHRFWAEYEKDWKLPEPSPELVGLFEQLNNPRRQERELKRRASSASSSSAGPPKRRRG